MGLFNVVGRASMAAGQPEDVTQVLANFDAIAAILNGGIDNSNVNAAAAILLSKLAGYPADGTKFAAGDGTWKSAGGAANINNVNIGAANTDLAAPTGSLNLWVASTATGTLRSIGVPSAGAGSRITLRNGTVNYITLKHQLAGGTGAQLYIFPGLADKYLIPGQSIELQYDGTNWVEVGRPAVETILDITLGADTASPFDTNTYLPAAGIPLCYKHLKIYLSVRSTQAANYEALWCRFNADGGNNYQYGQQYLQNGVIAGASSSAQAQGFLTYAPGATNDANLFGGVDVTVYEYASALKTKTSRALGSTPSSNVAASFDVSSSVEWTAAVAAITRFQAILLTGPNFKTGSRMMIEGIS